jgi:predicted RNA-binding Zn-ribbon protein involved in translation (DUF1610 family)
VLQNLEVLNAGTNIFQENIDMALKYACPSCGSDIIVRFLKVGEKAFCKTCRARSPVPKTAIEVEDPGAVPKSDIPTDSANTGESFRLVFVPTTTGLPVNYGRSAWNPRGFKWMGLFFSFFPVLVMAAYNWQRLGYPQKKKPLLIIAAVTLTVWLAFVSMLIFTPHVFESDRPFSTLLCLLNFVVGQYLGMLQTPAYKEFLNTGGQRRGYIRPIFNSLFFGLCLIVVTVVLLIVGEEYHQSKLKRAFQAFGAGQYESDRDMLENLPDFRRDMLEDIPDSCKDRPEFWHDLGIAYLKLGELYSAAAAFQYGRALDSNDIDFKLMLTYICEKLGWHPENGDVVTWHETGTKKTQSTYRQGRLDGALTEYWSDGGTRRIVNYKDGIINGQFELWNRDQSKFAQGSVANGKLHGPIICWHPETGIPETTAVYDNGVLLRGADMQELLR